MLEKNRIIALFLALCLSLSACGGKPVEEGTASQSDSAAESAETAEQEESSEDEAPDLTAPVAVPDPEPALTVEEVAAMEAGSIIPTARLPEEGPEAFFYQEEISDEVFQRINGISYREGCPVTREQLRYVRVLHWGFDGATHVGELICNKSTAQDMVDIFLRLYWEEYLIEKMLLVDHYGGDDEASMEDNNTSCFNYRPVSGTSTLSRHAYGLAIDINPLYNPYITSSGYEPANAGDYVDRSKDTPYKITSTDDCYLEFESHGFAWGGWWKNVKDYQHFEK